MALFTYFFCLFIHLNHCYTWPSCSITTNHPTIFFCSYPFLLHLPPHNNTAWPDLSICYSLCQKLQVERQSMSFWWANAQEVTEGNELNRRVNNIQAYLGLTYLHFTITWIILQSMHTHIYKYTIDQRFGANLWIQ